MMDEQQDHMDICEEELTAKSTITVKSKGIKNFLAVSKMKKDGKDDIFSKCESLTVHASCAKSYGASSHLKYNKNADTSALAPSSDVSAEHPSFDYESCCIFCGENASDKFIKAQSKKAVDRRVKVRCITAANTRTSLIKLFQQATDRNSLAVLYRVTAEEDLVAARARYHDACNSKFRANAVTVESEGSPSNISLVVTHICSYILAHKEECQFYVKDILNTFNIDHWPKMEYIENKLVEKFGSEIIIHKSKDGPVISFLNVNTNEILSDHWYENKKNDTFKERKRIVSAAAKILLGDIRGKFYETNYSAATDSSDSNVREAVPELLNLFLQELLINNKTSDEKIEKKANAIAHAVISAARPRSFVSPLLLGLASTLNKKFASKELLEILNSLGFSSSYEDTLLFEKSVRTIGEDLKSSDTDNTSYEVNPKKMRIE